MIHVFSPDLEIIRRYEDGPFARAWVARRMEAGDEAIEVVALTPPPGASQRMVEEFLAQGQRLTRLQEVLTERGETRLVPTLLEQQAGPSPYMLITMPRGPRLADRVKTQGRLAEVEGLELARSIALALEVLHNDLGLAAAPGVFRQTRWEPTDAQLYLPIWQGAAVNPTPARQALDLERAGLLLQFALIGQPLPWLWDRPLLLPRRHPAWQMLSTGACRLLRSLLHPSRELRLSDANNLHREATRLARAWQESPERLLTDAEDLASAALDGALAKAQEAADLLDILSRRDANSSCLTGRQALLLDELNETCTALLAHDVEVDRALRLASAGSFETALDLLRQADNGVRSSLALARWQAVLADANIAVLLEESNGLSTLHAALLAFEQDDLDTADAYLMAWTVQPASLSTEIELRKAWQQAVADQHKPEAALAALMQAQTALDRLPDPLRTALNQEMGNLASWRQAVTVQQVAGERGQWIDHALTRVHAARQAGRWTDAVSELHTAVVQEPDAPRLWREAQALALASLNAAQPAVAAEAFALLVAGGNASRAQHLGWQVAQALAALQADPVSSLAIAEIQAAVGALLSLQVQEGEKWPPLLPLRQALERGLSSAFDRTLAIASIPAGWAAQAIKHELQRLRSDMDPMLDSDLLAVLQEALYRAVAADRDAAVAFVSQWLSQIAEVFPAVPVSAQSGRNADGQPNDMTAWEAAKATINVLRKSMVERVNTMLAPEYPPGAIESSWAKQIAEQFYSPDLAQRADALQQYYNSDVQPAIADKLAPLIRQTEMALTEHREQMLFVMIALACQQRQNALDGLRRASNKGKSPVCWDWDAQAWTSLAIWQERIRTGYVPDLAAIDGHLESINPQRWDYVLRLPSSLFKQWPPTVQARTGQRRMDIDAHRSQMDRVFQQAMDDPSQALAAFNKQIVADGLEMCWDPRKKCWIKATDLRTELEQLLIQRAQSKQEPQPEAATAVLARAEHPALIVQEVDLFEDEYYLEYSSLAELLIQPLAESQTLTLLRQRLQGLMHVHTEHETALKQQFDSLEHWVHREKWLDELENRWDALPTNAERHNAQTYLIFLQALLAEECWKPYAHKDTPVFKRLWQRLESVISGAKISGASPFADMVNAPPPMAPDGGRAQRSLRPLPLAGEDATGAAEARHQPLTAQLPAPRQSGRQRPADEG